MRAFGLAAFLLLTVAVPTASAASSWCSPSGDACTSAAKRNGVQRLALTTFSFTGTVRICVTPPTGARTCKSFTLRERKGLYVVDVRWSTYFPNRGKGTYRVTFTPSVTGTKYGPTLSFRR